MKSVSFYKPNPFNKGSASQFQYGLKDGDNGLYVSIIKQASWNDQTKRGSFASNAKDPKKSKRIKLNANESAGICRVLAGLSEKWSTVHRSGEKITSLSFTPYIKDGVHMGFGLSIGEKAGESFMLSLTKDEGYVLEVFLSEHIKHGFGVAAPAQVETPAQTDTQDSDF